MSDTQVLVYEPQWRSYDAVLHGSTLYVHTDSALLHDHNNDINTAATLGYKVVRSDWVGLTEFIGPKYEDFIVALLSGEL